MVRVDFVWENEYGDERQTWATNIGQYSSNAPETLPNWIAANHIKLEPVNGEVVKKVLFSEISCYTITEVENV
jgi:hypothetical protein